MNGISSVFEKREKLCAVARSAIRWRRHRRVVDGAQRIVVRARAWIRDPDDDHVRHILVVQQPTLNGREQLEVPLAVEQIEHRMLRVGGARRARRQVDVELVVASGRHRVQAANLGVRDGHRWERVLRDRCRREASGPQGGTNESSNAVRKRHRVSGKAAFCHPDGCEATGGLLLRSSYTIGRK